MPRLIEKLIAIPGIRDLAVTTNGGPAGRQARSLYDAGLRRLNITSTLWIAPGSCISRV
jgi:cyclic pyranopterin phosphate synthase